MQNDHSTHETLVKIQVSMKPFYFIFYIISFFIVQRKRDITKKLSAIKYV